MCKNVLQVQVVESSISILRGLDDVVRPSRTGHSWKPADFHPFWIAFFDGRPLFFFADFCFLQIVVVTFMGPPCLSLNLLVWKTGSLKSINLSLLTGRKLGVRWHFIRRFLLRFWPIYSLICTEKNVDSEKIPSASVHFFHISIKVLNILHCSVFLPGILI